MSILDRMPAPALRWVGQQFRPVIGPVVKALSSRLMHGPRVVARGQAAGMRIDPAGAAAGYALGTSEPLIQDVFAEHVPRGGVVWDIGANIGFYSLIASRLVGNGMVVAFEPLPQNQEAIRRNLALNDVANVELVGIVLADREGEAELEIELRPRGRSSTPAATPRSSATASCPAGCAWRSRRSTRSLRALARRTS